MKIGSLISINYSQLKVKISSEIRGGSVNYLGNIYYFGNIGSYLKITNAVEETIICEVISIFDADVHQDRQSFDVESNRELLVKPIGTINSRDEFTLGVGVFPSLYSDVSIVTNADMKSILRTKAEVPSTDDQNDKIHDSFYLGVSKNLINYPINVNIDNFFNIHTAVLGNSGSGKSNTIAHILQEIFKKKRLSATGSRFVIFDVNGEYKEAFEESINDEISIKFYKPNISANNDGYEPFYLPHYLMSLDEWSAFLLATEATQRPFWNRVLQESYRFYSIGTSDPAARKKFVNYLRYKVCSLVLGTLMQADTDTARITTAAGVLGSIANIIGSDSTLQSAAADLLLEIQTLQDACQISYGDNDGKLENATREVGKNIVPEDVEAVANSKLPSGKFFDYKFLKIAAELILLEEDARGNKQIRGYTATMLTRLEYFLENSECEFMRRSNGSFTSKEYLNKFWNPPSAKTQLAVIDTSELAPDTLETLTSVASRLFFEERRQLIGQARRESPIHLILDEAHRYIKKDYDYILKENIFEKIAREGRKYSYYLIISSQRPSELSDTVLSQCSNFVIHRIQNERDMHYIEAILPYFSDDFKSKIKQSAPGEALVFGNCVSMPLHLKIHESSPSPNSKNCEISKEWFKKVESTSPARPVRKGTFSIPTFAKDS